VGSHPLAEKISVWIEANKSKIRVRHADTEKLRIGDQPQLEISARGILLEREYASLKVTLPGGVGESLLLAAKLRIPLYSDESCIRQWAVHNHELPSLSTLGLARSLVETGKWTLDEETVLITDLIRRNFRWVQFSPLHLNSCLHRVIQDCKSNGIQVTSEVLRTDDRMLSLMKWFGELSVKEGVRALTAIEWWLSIVNSDFFARDSLVASMIYPTNCIATASQSSVVAGTIHQYEREQKAAALLAILLWKSSTFMHHATDVWFAIKDCVEHLFVRSEEQREMILFRFMPKRLLDAAYSERPVSREEKNDRLFKLISRLPERDREPFEVLHVKNLDKMR